LCFVLLVPASDRYVPAEQEEHEEEPVLAAYVPAGHTLQEEASVVVEYVPAWHDWHSSLLSL
jgi:hypothetical protein